MTIYMYISLKTYSSKLVQYAEIFFNEKHDY